MTNNIIMFLKGTNRSITSHTSSIDELQYINSRNGFVDPTANEKPRHRIFYQRELVRTDAGKAISFVLNVLNLRPTMGY